jgi:hypothetical protein
MAGDAFAMAGDAFAVAGAARPRACAGSRRSSGARASPSAVLGMRKAHKFADCDENDACQGRAQGVGEAPHVSPS